MAKRLTEEENIQIHCSLTKKEKHFVDENGFSPTKLLKIIVNKKIAEQEKINGK